MPEPTVAEIQQALTSSAVAGAIAASGVEVHEHARSQLASLISAEVNLVPHNGQLVPCGPGLRPINDHVREALARPEFSHFLKAGKTLPGTPGRAVAQAPLDMAAMDALPIGERVVAMTNHARGPAGDGRDDPRFSFGLPSSRRPA